MNKNPVSEVGPRHNKSIPHKLMPLIIALFLIGVTGCTERADMPEPEYAPPDLTFPEAGLTVTGDFLRFYNIYGGKNSLGAPISEEMIEGGWWVQYFEYGRLEHHPENEPDYRVTVGWLGDLLGRRMPPLPSSAIPRNTHLTQRYYAKTGHTLSGDFLTYFDSNGGSVRFGLPISEPFLLNGQVTQDFQSARFFWTPHDSPPVQLEAIGLTHLTVISPGHTIKPQ
jgi:hypothetical protein